MKKDGAWGLHRRPDAGNRSRVNVGRGQVVREGETLAVIEAMKMELALKAPFAGTVASVAASAGQQVDLGVELLRIVALTRADPRRRGGAVTGLPEVDAMAGLPRG